MLSVACASVHLPEDDGGSMAEDGGDLEAAGALHNATSNEHEDDRISAALLAPVCPPHPFVCCASPTAVPPLH